MWWLCKHPRPWPQLLLTLLMALSPAHSHEVAKKSDAPRAEERMLERATEGLRSIESSLTRLLKMVELDNLTTIASDLPPTTPSTTPQTLHYPTLSPSPSPTLPPSPTRNHSHLIPKPVFSHAPESSHTPYFTLFSVETDHITTQHPTHTFPRPFPVTQQTDTPSDITLTHSPSSTAPPFLPTVLSGTSHSVIDASHPVDASSPLVNTSRPEVSTSHPAVDTFHLAADTSHLAIHTPHPQVNTSEAAIDTLHSAVGTPHLTADTSHFNVAQPPIDTLTFPTSSSATPKAPNTGTKIPDPVIDSLHKVADANATAPITHSLRHQHPTVRQPNAMEEDAEISTSFPPPHSHISEDNPRTSSVVPQIPPEGWEGADIKSDEEILPMLNKALVEDAAPTYSAPGETADEGLTVKNEGSSGTEDRGGSDSVQAEVGMSSHRDGAVWARTKLNPGEENYLGDAESTGSAGEENADMNREDVVSEDNVGLHKDRRPIQSKTKISTSEDGSRAAEGGEVRSHEVNEDKTISADEENIRHHGNKTYEMTMTPEREENESSKEIMTDNEENTDFAKYKTVGVEGRKISEESNYDFTNNAEEELGSRSHETHSLRRKIEPGHTTNEENGHSNGHQTNHVYLNEDISGLPSGTEKGDDRGRKAELQDWEEESSEDRSSKENVLADENMKLTKRLKTELAMDEDKGDTGGDKTTGGMFKNGMKIIDNKNYEILSTAGNSYTANEDKEGKDEPSEENEDTVREDGSGGEHKLKARTQDNGEETSSKKKTDEDKETLGKQDGKASEKINDNREIKGMRTAEDSEERGEHSMTEDNTEKEENREKDTPYHLKTNAMELEGNGETENGKEDAPNQGDRWKVENEAYKEPENPGWNELGGGEESNTPIQTKANDEEYQEERSPKHRLERRSAAGEWRRLRHIAPPPPHVHPHPCTPRTPLSKRILCHHLSRVLLAVENATEELFGGKMTETGVEKLQLRAEELKEVVAEVEKEEEVDPVFTSSLDKVGLTSDLHALLQTVAQVQDEVSSKLLAVRGMGLALVVALALVGALLLLALCSAVALVVVRRRQVRREELYRKQVCAEQIPVRSFLECGHENQAFREEERRPSARSIPRLRPRQDSCQSYNLTREGNSPRGGSPLGQKFTSCPTTQLKPDHFSPDRRNHNAKKLHGSGGNLHRIEP